MSKSKGNVLEASELLDNYPADLVRFYFMWKASPIEPLNFSTKELMSRPYQVISTLYHLHTFYKQNSEYDKFDINESTVEWAKKNNLLTPPDIWLLSKLQRMIQSFKLDINSREIFLFKFVNFSNFLIIAVDRANISSCGESILSLIISVEADK